MTYTSTVVPSAVALAEPIDRAPFKARPGSAEHHHTSRLPAAYADAMHNRAGATATYTLRIKPDRRRAQVPIAPGSDRRRSR